MIHQFSFKVVLLGFALALGISGDGLLRVTPWGLNFMLWSGAVIIVVAGLAQWRTLSAGRDGRWLLVLLFLSSATPAWRDSPVLNNLGALALFIMFGISVIRIRKGHIFETQITDFFLGFLLTFRRVLDGFFSMVFREIPWKNISDERQMQIKAAIRGLVFAVPLLLIFGFLLMKSDMRFEKMVTRFFNLKEFFSHFVLISFFTVLSAGILKTVFIEENWDIMSFKSFAGKKSGRLGGIEMSIILGSLNILFLMFIMVQMSYFFGGDEFVINPSGPSYSEYARRGFFEMVTVAVLILPLLLVLHWMIQDNSAFQEKVFRVLAGSLVSMVFIILASAAHRMHIYQEAYGLTELRLYTSAFMVWLAGALFWFIATVLFGRRNRFGFGVLSGGVVVIMMLHILNPDAFIIKTNMERYKKGHAFDINYACSLSTDALPAFIASLPDLNNTDRVRSLERITKRLPLHKEQDWRSWNWSRANAKKALKTYLKKSKIL